MSEEADDCLASLKEDVRKLKEYTAVGNTLVTEIGMFVLAGIFLICLVAYALIDREHFFQRLVFGGITIGGGLFIYLISIELVQISFKALVELSNLSLFLTNGLTGLVLLRNMEKLKPWVSEFAYRSEIDLPDIPIGLIVIVSAAVMLLIFDLFVLFTLFPLAKVAGTKLEP